MAYERRMFNGGAITTTVPLQVGAADASFTLAASTNWPDGSTGNFFVVIDQSSPEKIKCTSRTGLVVTVAASGRGADGTSAVSHVAGSQIQCVHGAQDDDEANQVVTAVLGQASAAKGDIPVILSAAGPVTLTRLGVGANGSVLSAASATPAYSLAGTSGMLLQSAGSAVPTWLVPPGYLLATQDYTSAGGTTKTFTVTTLTAFDTTNFTLAFTVPASGNVDLVVTGSIGVGTSTSMKYWMGLLNHSGGAQVGFSNTLLTSDGAYANGLQNFSTKFHLTGLTPGALQLDLAGAYTGAGVNLAALYIQGAIGTPAGGNQLIMQAFAA